MPVTTTSGSPPVKGVGGSVTPRGAERVLYAIDHLACSHRADGARSALTLAVATAVA